MRDIHYTLLLIAAVCLLGGAFTVLRYQSCMDAIGSTSFCLMNTLR